MALQFSDTTNKNGIIQGIERSLFGDSGDGRISGNSTFLKQFTSDVNLAMSQALALIFRVGGKWNFDDSNHTDYPIITTNLVDGQRDYTFTTDEQGNLVLDVFRVFVKNQGGTYDEAFPVDSQSESGTESLTDGQEVEGIPYRYDKTANGIFLDPVPSYNSTGGLKVYISREHSYFTSADTTKKPGIAGLFHEYLVLRPAYMYAYRNGLTNAPALQGEVLRMERAMEEYYAKRERDVRNVITPKLTSYL